MARSVLIWQRPTNTHTTIRKDDTMAASTTSTTTPPASQALADAQELLAPFADDPQVGPILTALEEIDAPENESSADADDPDRVEKALISTRDAIEKCEFPEIRQRLEKAHTALQLEALARVNPGAAYAYERARGA
jgi:hypothetical protein